MKKILTSFLLITLTTTFSPTLKAQSNLVPNPSFEIYDTCPNNYLQISRAVPWFNPSKYSDGFANYFNSCSANPNIGVPSNIEGFQYARTGNAYGGILLYAYDEDRIYLEVMLTDSMRAGKKYCVEYFVSIGIPYTIATDNFHFYFSNDSLYSDTTSYYAIQVIPSVINPLGRYISDTLNWTKISGIYTAHGGERFLTIGNFYDNARTDTIIIGNTSGGTSVYYFIDDVSVIDCDSLNNVSDYNNPSIKIFPNPAHNQIEITGNDIQSLTLYDVLGRVIYLSKQEISSPHTINTTSFSRGIYFLQARTKGGMVVRKVVLQ